MKTFHITGIDTKTGQPLTLDVSAASEFAAESEAAARGCRVLTIVASGERQSDALPPEPPHEQQASIAPAVETLLSKVEPHEPAKWRTPGPIWAWLVGSIVFTHVVKRVFIGWPLPKPQDVDFGSRFIDNLVANILLDIPVIAVFLALMYWLNRGNVRRSTD